VYSPTATSSANAPVEEVLAVPASKKSFAAAPSLSTATKFTEYPA
jgi:hypothetical protein